MAQRLKRSEVPVELTWNLTDLYQNVEAWESDLACAEAQLADVTAFRGRLGEGAGVLLALFQTRDALMERLARTGAFASLRSSEDGSSPDNQALAARFGSLAARVSAELAFIPTEILALPPRTVARYLEQEPGLAVYRRQLEEIERMRPHVLSPETERALGALSETLDAPNMIYRRTVASDFDFPPIEVGGQKLPMSVALYAKYAGSTDRETRRKAYESLTQGLDRHKTALASTLAATIKRNVTLAKLRGFETSAELFLKPQDVPLEVYENVLNIVQAEAAPHVRRYVRLRQRVLGLDRVHRYDLTAPLDPAYDPRSTFEESGRLIKEGLAVLGDEYGQILEAAFRDRWVDRADNVGKSTGAFCHSVYGVHPYILMTWQDKMRDTFVLAHELGHAGHGVLAARNQVISNTRSTRFFVEAPSTANELILGRHILSHTEDPRLRRWVVMQFLGTFMHNMVTHMLEAELERRLYVLAESGQPITLKVVREVQGDVYEGFFGDTLVVDDGARLTWMTVPHFYVGLYPFTYAAGLSVSVAVTDAIRREGAPAAERWLNTLRAGGTLAPLELMEMAGVNMRSPEPIRNAVAMFGRLVDELEASFA